MPISGQSSVSEMDRRDSPLGLEFCRQKKERIRQHKRQNAHPFQIREAKAEKMAVCSSARPKSHTNNIALNWIYYYKKVPLSAWASGGLFWLNVWTPIFRSWKKNLSIQNFNGRFSTRRLFGRVVQIAGPWLTSARNRKFACEQHNPTYHRFRRIAYMGRLKI